jgi:hypothetical protein
MSYEEGRANKAFIVKCVNHHDELVAVLSALFEHCAMVHSKWGDHCNREEASAAVESGRNLLAKLEGVSSE